MIHQLSVGSLFHFLCVCTWKPVFYVCVACVLCYPNSLMDSRLHGERAWQKFTFINHNLPLCAATSANLVLDIPELPDTSSDTWAKPQCTSSTSCNTQTHNTSLNPYKINFNTEPHSVQFVALVWQKFPTYLQHTSQLQHSSSLTHSNCAEVQHPFVGNWNVIGVKNNKIKSNKIKNNSLGKCSYFLFRQIYFLFRLKHWYHFHEVAFRVMVDLAD